MTSNFLKAVQAWNFIKKETLAQVFSSEFCEVCKNTFFIEHLWAAASVNWILRKVIAQRTEQENFRYRCFSDNIANFPNDLTWVFLIH